MMCIAWEGLKFSAGWLLPSLGSQGGLYVKLRSFTSLALSPHHHNGETALDCEPRKGNLW